MNTRGKTQQRLVSLQECSSSVSLFMADHISKLPLCACDYNALHVHVLIVTAGINAVESIPRAVCP